jgi:NAD(P)-dependent dehydrogenase (short-subunit alcohol dehydrogenase family)
MEHCADVRFTTMLPELGEEHPCPIPRISSAAEWPGIRGMARRRRETDIQPEESGTMAQSAQSASLQDQVFDWEGLRHDLASRVTLVTGGAQGTGRKTAEALLTLGCPVMIADINAKRLAETEKELAALGKGRIAAVVADVTKADQCKAMAEAAVKHFGKLNNVVYCAGAVRAQRPTLEVDSDEWDLIIDSNLKGAFLTCQAAIPHIVEAGGGSIVHISSRAGRTSSPFLGIHYTSAKAGILGLTRHIAKEFGDKGIRANSICPGGILGERMSFLMGALKREHELEWLARQSPLGRNVWERDVVGVILFLLSDLSGFVTGATIDCNGGTLMI